MTYVPVFAVTLILVTIFAHTLGQRSLNMHVRLLFTVAQNNKTDYFSPLFSHNKLAMFVANYTFKATGDRVCIRKFFASIEPFVSRQRKQLWSWNKRQNIADVVIKTAVITLKQLHCHESQAMDCLCHDLIRQVLPRQRLLTYYLLLSYCLLNLLQCQSWFPSL